MTRTEIGMLLARARVQAAMTQSRLAEAMGTTQPVVARAEGGYRMPTIDFIDRWAKATGTPLSITFGRPVQSGDTPAQKRALVDSVMGPGRSDAAALRSAGLRMVGQHWIRDDLPVAVEFPGSGDEIRRTVRVVVDRIAVQMISCEDLYVERIRQATAGWPHEDVSFDGAFEIALTNYATMDWEYVAERIATAAKRGPLVGETMRRVNRRVRARARRQAIQAPQKPNR